MPVKIHALLAQRGFNLQEIKISTAFISNSRSVWPTGLSEKTRLKLCKMGIRPGDVTFFVKEGSDEIDEKRVLLCNPITTGSRALCSPFIHKTDGNVLIYFRKKLFVTASYNEATRCFLGQEIVKTPDGVYVSFESPRNYHLCRKSDGDVFNGIVGTVDCVLMEG